MYGGFDYEHAAAEQTKAVGRRFSHREGRMQPAVRLKRLQLIGETLRLRARDDWVPDGHAAKPLGQIFNAENLVTMAETRQPSIPLRERQQHAEEEFANIR